MTASENQRAPSAEAFKRAVYELAGTRPVDPEDPSYEPVWTIDVFEVERRAAEIDAHDPAAPAPPAGDMRSLLEGVLRQYDRNTCHHEETHRAGFIWTVCDGCGRKWADDQGGFKAYEDPPEIARARDALAGHLAVVAPSPERRGEAKRDTIAFLIADICEKRLEHDAELGICGAGTVGFEAADAILALCAAEPETPALTDDFFDFRPDLKAATPEASLRMILRRYYRPWFSEEEADRLTERYIAALRALPTETPVLTGEKDWRVIEKTWRDAGLPEYFLGNGGTNHGLYAFAAALRALPARQSGLTLRTLHEANIARQAEWCPDQVPDLSFRGNELAGETGEACNVIKKLERERQGWRGSRATLADLAEELADVVICADLCAVTAGIDLDAAVVAKFNATSDKVGISVRLPDALPARQEGWQPIETAPKDGEPVDLWGHWPERDEWKRSANAKWVDGSWVLGVWREHQFMHPPRFTHWMRPAAPAQGGHDV
jgi:NTP pyrophosphatase (non-canonical NTP hydrolase)